MNKPEVHTLEMTPQQLFEMLERMPRPIADKLAKASEASLEAIIKVLGSTNYDIEVKITPRFSGTADDMFVLKVREHVMAEVDKMAKGIARETIEQHLQHADMQALASYAELLEQLQKRSGGES